MTDGEILKKNLGLSKFPYVKISRVEVGGTKLYSVVYNSRSPYRPITTSMMRQDPRIVQFVQNDFNLPYRRIMTPYVPIESFTGSVNTAVYVVTDISGYFHDEKMFDFYLTEGRALKKNFLVGKLDEFLTIPEIMASTTGSDITNFYTKEREGIQATITRNGKKIKVKNTASANTKLIQVDIDDDLNPTFSFLADATKKYGDDHVYKEVDPSNFELKDDPSKTYTLQIKILDFIKWIDTYPKGYQFTAKDLKDVLKTANVQVWNSSPSFLYQGYCYKMTQMDAAIYPINISDAVWGKRHNDSNFIDKHLRQLFDQMPFFLNQMASMLNKKLKGVI